MAATIQLRRGTASQWTAANPVLATGEPGYESDTGKFKIGNGSTAWTSLSYATSTNLDSLTDVVITSVANGQTLQYNGSNWVNADAAAAYNPVEAAVFS